MASSATVVATLATPRGCERAENRLPGSHRNGLAAWRAHSDVLDRHCVRVFHAEKHATFAGTLRVLELLSLILRGHSQAALHSTLGFSLTRLGLTHVPTLQSRQ